MAAGLGFKTFTTGEVLTAADVNGYLMQGVLVFASAAARTSAITSPQEGQYSFLKDTNALEYYDGAAWVGAPVGDITAVTAGTGISGGGSSGAVTITNDMATTITASGDIVVGTGNGTYDNLPIGSTGQVLTADTTVSPYKVKWAAAAAASFKGALVYMANGVTQSLSNNTYTAINFATEQFDTDAFHSTVTNTNRLTIPTGLGGYYQIYANLRFDTNGTGIRRLDFEVNGSGNTYGVSIFTPNSASNSTVASTITLNLVAGDWVGIQALQTSGGNLNVQGNSAIAGSFFGITYLGA